MSALKLNFLSDAPILKSEKEYYEFYHKYISPALHNIVKTKSKVHTIGLFGTWGSGKSTIIDNLKKDYSDFPVFIFDAWKYQGDPLRRTFLINFFQFIKDNKLWAKGKKLDDGYLEELYVSIATEEKVEKQPKKGKRGWLQKIRDLAVSVGKFILKHLLFVGLVLFSVSWLMLQIRLGENNQFVHKILLIVGYVSQSSSVAMIIGWVAKKIVEKLASSLFDDLKGEIKTESIIKTRNFLNSPEQFEEKFNELIACLNKKIVVVFDNIDRVQGDVAIELLTSIKTFFDPKESKKAIFIIPCDSDAIAAQIKKYYGENDIAFEPSEYLRKLFNVVIWTPEFISTDLEDFTRKLIRQLGPDYTLLNNEDLILVVSQAFKSNPREIKQFLNNVIASLLIISQTEVWDIVEKNISYLAKTLVLKQKYPEAYKRLKEKWYDPENIENPDPKKVNQNLHSFLVDTGSITVPNAEPYIYYKRPNRTKEIKGSEELATALVSEDKDKSKVIIGNNKNKIDKVLSFIEGLLVTYGYDPNLLTNIIVVFLASLTELSIKFAHKIGFLNKIAEIIDRKVWSNYQKLPIEPIFNEIIRNPGVKKILRDKLIMRYVTVLGDQELGRGTGVDKAIEIINSFKKVKLNGEQMSELQRNISERHFAETRVMMIFESINEQTRFVSKEALEKYIKNINHDNYPHYLPILTQYKEHIRNLNLSQNVVETLQALLNQERTKTPEDNPNKRTLFRVIKELIVEPNNIIGLMESPNVSPLGTEVFESYRTAGDVNMKFYMISVLYKLSPFFEEGQKSEADNMISEFLKTSLKETFETVINELHDMNEAPNFITQFINALKEKTVSKGFNEIIKAYELTDKVNKQEIINSMIEQQPDLGLSTIQSLQKIPNKTQTMVKILDRVSKLSELQSKRIYYDWIVSSIKTSDDQSIKSLLVEHIKLLLKSDDPVSQEIGFGILQKSHFLSITAKREIASEIIEWLKTPGKVINSNYENCLGAAAFLFSILSSTTKGELIHILFDLLDHQEERPVLEMATRILVQIQTKWRDYENDFVDFKGKITGWTNADNKNYVVGELVKLEPKKPNKKEKNYWKELALIKG